MQNRKRCCLLNLLPIIEGGGNCCNKIENALKYYNKHIKHEITEMGGNSEENITLFIRPISGGERTYTIEMSSNATVGEMKTEIEKKSGIPVNYQRNFRSHEVRNPVRLDNNDDQRKLGSYNLMDTQTLFMAVRWTPGAVKGGGISRVDPVLTDEDINKITEYLEEFNREGGSIRLSNLRKDCEGVVGKSIEVCTRMAYGAISSCLPRNMALAVAKKDVHNSTDNYDIIDGYMNFTDIKSNPNWTKSDQTLAKQHTKFAQKAYIVFLKTNELPFDLFQKLGEYIYIYYFLPLIISNLHIIIPKDENAPVYIVFSGTFSLNALYVDMSNVKALYTDDTDPHGNIFPGKVNKLLHLYSKIVYILIHTHLKEEFKKKRTIHIIGHSLGGVFAQLTAANLKFNEKNKLSCSLKVWSYGAFPFGDKEFQIYYNQNLNLKNCTYNFFNYQDLAPRLFDKKRDDCFVTGIKIRTCMTKRIGGLLQDFDNCSWCIERCVSRRSPESKKTRCECLTKKGLFFNTWNECNKEACVEATEFSPYDVQMPFPETTNANPFIIVGMPWHISYLGTIMDAYAISRGIVPTLVEQLSTLFTKKDEKEAAIILNDEYYSTIIVNQNEKQLRLPKSKDFVQPVPEHQSCRLPQPSEEEWMD